MSSATGVTTHGPMVLPMRTRAFWQDPHPLFDAAREQYRTAVSESGEPVVLTIDDVEAISAHPLIVPLGLDALDRLTEAELYAMVINLIGGAIGSSQAAIANAAYLFARNPDEAALLRTGPELDRAAVEECLRHAPPFRSTRRKAVGAVHIAGLDLVEGDARVGRNRKRQIQLTGRCYRSVSALCRIMRSSSPAWRIQSGQRLVTFCSPSSDQGVPRC